MEFETDITAEQYAKPVTSKGPSVLIEKRGQVLVLENGVITSIGSKNKNILVKFEVPDPNAASMIANEINYPTSLSARFKLAELDAIQQFYKGGKIELKNGKLTVNDKALIGQGISVQFVVEEAGEGAPNPGTLYWKPVRLTAPKAAAPAA